MAKTAGAGTIATHVPHELRALIQGRAEGIQVSESRFIRLILEKWVADGCQAVTPLDEMAQRVAPKRKTA